MNHFRLTAEAAADVTAITEYLAERNLTAALNLVDAFDEHFTVLAANPRMGELRRDLPSALRSFTVRNYVIYFRPMTNGVEIVRVLHGARDARSVLES